MPFNSGFSALSPIAYMDGSAIAPPVSFRSDASLGLYRSTASTIALSFGTLDLSAGTAKFGNTTFGTIVGSVTHTGSAIFANGVGMLMNMSSGNQGIIIGDGGNVITVRGGSSGIQHKNNANSVILWVWTDPGYLSARSGGFLSNASVAILPGFAFSSESSLGFWRSSASVLALSYGLLALPDGSNTTPSIGYSSNTSLGLYSSGVQTIAQSLGTLNLATNSVRFSMRTLAASSVTASAAKTNVAVNEVVFTIGGASGASLIIYSGGTAYGFNSAFSAAAS